MDGWMDGQDICMLACRHGCICVLAGMHVCTMHAHAPHLNIDVVSLRSMSKVLSGSCVDCTRLGGVDSTVRAQAQAAAHGPRCRMIHMQDQNRRWVPRCPVTLVSCPFRTHRFHWQFSSFRDACKTCNSRVSGVLHEGAS